MQFLGLTGACVLAAGSQATEVRSGDGMQPSVGEAVAT